MNIPQTSSLYSIKHSYIHCVFIVFPPSHGVDVAGLGRQTSLNVPLVAGSVVGITAALLLILAVLTIPVIVAVVYTRLWKKVGHFAPMKESMRPLSLIENDKAEDTITTGQK